MHGLKRKKSLWNGQPIHQTSIQLKMYGLYYPGAVMLMESNIPKEELKTAIEREWSNIKISELRNFISSMPNRIFEVIRENGAKTKY